MTLADPATKLRLELIELAGEADANTIMSNFSGASANLASLGPAVGFAQVANGKMSREDFLKRYGHRGPHELELFRAGNEEDKDWLDRQVAVFAQSPTDVEGLLANQRTKFENVWERFQTGHARVAEKFQRKLNIVAIAARNREAGSAHLLMRLVKWYEGAIGRRADMHLFVSSAMREALAAEWGLQGIVFRDRPAESFEPITASERERMREDLRTRMEIPAAGHEFAMAVSPTSWTADEDFDLLIDAVARSEALIRSLEASGHSFPELVILLTGRGPLRQRFETQLTSRRFSRVHLRTMWLEPGAYAKVVATGIKNGGV